jgi:hypothetical protein
MSDKLLYNNKPIDIKLSFTIRYKLISIGLNIASALITENTSLLDFCKTWSILLDEPFNDKVENMDEEIERFLKGFSMLEAVNPYYLYVLKRDGLFEDEEKNLSDKKKSKKTLLNK